MEMLISLQNCTLHQMSRNKKTTKYASTAVPINTQTHSLFPPPANNHSEGPVGQDKIRHTYMETVIYSYTDSALSRHSEEISHYIMSCEYSQ